MAFTIPIMNALKGRKIVLTTPFFACVSGISVIVDATCLKSKLYFYESMQGKVDRIRWFGQIE